MKITGGKYKNKNIEARPDKTLRPTAGRIREAIFNILKHGKFLKNEDFIGDGEDLVEGRDVVDIFCGTGALGIEALSRGAASLTLIDQNPKTLEMARANVANIGELGNTKFIRSDSTLLPAASKPCQLAFIDPPYNRNLVIPALKSLANNGWLDKGAVIVIEQGKKDDLMAPDGFKKLDERVHDKTKVIILQFTG